MTKGWNNSYLDFVQDKPKKCICGAKVFLIDTSPALPLYGSLSLFRNDETETRLVNS